MNLRKRIKNSINFTAAIDKNETFDCNVFNKSFQNSKVFEQKGDLLNFKQRVKIKKRILS